MGKLIWNLTFIALMTTHAVDIFILMVRPERTERPLGWTVLMAVELAMVAIFVAHLARVTYLERKKRPMVLPKYLPLLGILGLASLRESFYEGRGIFELVDGFLLLALFLAGVVFIPLNRRKTDGLPPSASP